MVHSIYGLSSMGYRLTQIMPQLKTQSGITWHFDLEGQGEVLLFLHGWGVNRRIWRQQFKHFRQGYRVLMIDLPGHGETPWIKSSLEVMARDIAEILTAAKVTKVTIVGSSLGGLLAIKFYELFPGAVRRVIFVGSMPKFSKSADYPFGLDVAQIRKLGGQLNDAYPGIVNIFFRSLFTKEERASRRFRWLQKFKKFDAIPFKDALAEYLDILEEEDLREVLRRMELPLQFINGTGDHICNRDAVAYLKSVVPHARFVDFEECGHFPFLSQAYEFNTVMEKFLKESH